MNNNVATKSTARYARAYSLTAATRARAYIAAMILLFITPVSGQENAKPSDEEVMHSTPQWGEQYLLLAPDIPLADGWEEIYDEGSFFDKPEGRILTAYAKLSATAKPNPAKTIQFYRDTMPNLGWQFSSNSQPLILIFHRDQERLEVKLTTGRLGIKLTPVANEPE